MIETYKIINEKYDPEASSFLKLRSTQETDSAEETTTTK
jgi:hypothetical protein